MTDEDRGPLTDEEQRVLVGAARGAAAVFLALNEIGSEGGFDHALAKHIVEHEDDVLALLRFAFRKLGEEIR
jgi:hypothetical protein